LFYKPDDLLGAESALLHVRPLGFTDFIASAGTAQWGQVIKLIGFKQEIDRQRWLIATATHVMDSMGFTTSLTLDANFER
ncbi:hypothetical protein IPQ92_16290, partial [Xanthomonas perforans]|nr:hypothetical protein [Xanthomonas perforans]